MALSCETDNICKYFSDDIGDLSSIIHPITNSHLDINNVSIRHHLLQKYGYHWDGIEKIRVRLNCWCIIHTYNVCKDIYYINYKLIPDMDIFKLKINMKDEIYMKYTFTLFYNNIKLCVFNDKKYGYIIPTGAFPRGYKLNEYKNMFIYITNKELSEISTTLNAAEEISEKFYVELYGSKVVIFPYF